MVKKIQKDETLLAIIIPSNYHKPGISFFTPGELSQQLAYMEHPTGHLIEPHVHNIVKREIQYTREVLIIRKGKLRVDFYDDEKTYVESHIVEAGDIILLVSGGHGFKVIENVEMFEVKQGPYVGEADKMRFSGITEKDIRLGDGVNAKSVCE